MRRVGRESIESIYDSGQMGTEGLWFPCGGCWRSITRVMGRFGSVALGFGVGGLEGVKRRLMSISNRCSRLFILGDLALQP
jgi:hypothetical protein